MNLLSGLQGLSLLSNQIDIYSDMHQFFCTQLNNGHKQESVALNA